MFIIQSPLGRRGFLRAMLVAASGPLIVRAASLMPIRALDAETEEFIITGVGARNTMLTIQMITREAVRLWKNETFLVGGGNHGLKLGDRITVCK